MAPPAHVDRLRAVLESVSPLGDSAWREIVPYLGARSCAKGEILLRAGDVATQVLFVGKGLLREFYTTANGVEATRRLCGEGELSGSLADLLSGAPALVSVEALEASELIELRYAAFDALTEGNPLWLRLARRIAEALYLRKTQREFEMLTLPAAVRYRNFADEHPGFEERVSQRVVASYLGITPVHLSRLRAANRSGRSA